MVSTIMKILLSIPARSDRVVAASSSPVTGGGARGERVGNNSLALLQYAARLRSLFDAKGGGKMDGFPSIEQWME